MSHRLIDLNPDLHRLRNDGYNIDIHATYLVVRDIPYVDEQRKVHRDGIIVTDLDQNGDIVNKPPDHQVKFIGARPCTNSGEAIPAFAITDCQMRLSDKLATSFNFSSKPECGYYESYFEKIKTYAAILTGYAVAIDPDANPRTYRVEEPYEEDSPFNYADTASARAGINMITNKLAVSKLAIIGLGGSGSYVLDQLAKTPVKEIHLFDGDKFSSHNAFRAPGAASKDELHKQPLKVDYFKERYSPMHRGIIAHGEYLDATNIDQIQGMACVFLCIDAGPGKKFIVEKLEEFGLPFIDTGMGLYVTDEKIGGIVRVVTSEGDRRKQARSRMSFASDDGDNQYNKNIQIADLNALNAMLAVIRWKKMCGFYFDYTQESFASYTIGTNRLLSEDTNGLCESDAD